MSNSMVTLTHPAVNAKRFVPPLSEREQGVELYRRGKPLRECVTDDMADGWLTAEAAGADAYYRCMAAEASEVC